VQLHRRSAMKYVLTYTICLLNKLKLGEAVVYLPVCKWPCKFVNEWILSIAFSCLAHSKCTNMQEEKTTNICIPESSIQMTLVAAMLNLSSIP
jgi:hypothetical protein